MTPQLFAKFPPIRISNSKYVLFRITLIYIFAYGSGADDYSMVR